MSKNTFTPSPKIAIVHDFLTQYGGAERCLETFKEIFPDASIFTLLYDNKKLPQYKHWDIRTSFLQKFPFWRRNHYIYFPLYQYAIEKFDLSGFDIVLSSSVNYAKGIIAPKALHICYCYTAPRFVYIMKEKYIQHYNFFIKPVVNFFINRFEKWDLKAKNRPNFYIAISQNVQQRLKKYYNIDSEVIHPPIDTEFFRLPEKTSSQNYFLIVSRLKEYKNLDLAIKCFNKLGLELKIIGDGNYKSYLKKISEPNIEFLGNVKDEELLRYYQNSKAIIVPGEEDFGLVSLEAQACGAPVIAFKKGGALETVMDGKTGIFFDEETSDSLVKAIDKFEKLEFDRNMIRENALGFDRGIFKKKIKEFIFSKLLDK